MSIAAFYFGLPMLVLAVFLLPVLLQSWRREAKVNIWIAQLKSWRRPPQQYEFDSSSWTGR